MKILSWFLSLLLFLCTLQATETNNHSRGDQLFTLKISPLLQEKCLACHSGKEGKLKGDLDLSSLDGMLFGGETSEKVLVPKKPDESLLLTAIEWKDPDYEMPPKENDKLTEKQIQYFREWIELGSPWPSQEIQDQIKIAERKKIQTDEGIIVKNSGGLSDDWTYRRYKPEDLWAFQPVQKPKIPASLKNPIDYFVEKKLDETQISPAPTADFRSLVKRAYLDLHGLPPTPYEIYQFRLSWDKNPEKAWDELIDQLMESQHFGERSAQHWLDVARYADTAGLSNDYERSNMWRYRDYVVRSFNEDKPYDRFIIEQIAGDELWEKQPIDEKNSELLIATSFLRMGPWDPAMVLKPQARQLYLDDVVNAVGQTFLSTTMRCFKCHDHKFDPLPTRDYYRFYSVFSQTQLAERPAEFIEQENLRGMNAGKEATERMLSFAKNKYEELYNKQEEAAKKWFAEHKKEYLDENKRRSLPDEEKPPRHVGLTPTETGRLKVRRQDDWIWTRRLERYQPLAQSVYNGPVPKSLNSRIFRFWG